MVPLDTVAWHAGQSTWKGKSGLNGFSVGISFVNSGTVNKDKYRFVSVGGPEVLAGEVVEGDATNSPTRYWHALTARQIGTALAVSEALLAAYPSLVDGDVVGHDEIALPQGRKLDPGPLFPKGDFQKELRERTVIRTAPHVDQDGDGDGVPDSKDRCPKQRGEARYAGCKSPAGDGDRDGDGFKDSYDACPDDPEDFDGFQDEDGCPDPDNDKDGILDINDRCPNVPEDIDGDHDTDGCPEVDADGDRDGDGIADSRDKCPDDVEDRDGFEDTDGCPDPDNDRDGIPDRVDQCPDDAEDKDGFEDTDGCPDFDNDKDQIPDIKDKCPNDPETYNGFQDTDGCPDKPTTAAVAEEAAVERQLLLIGGESARACLSSSSLSFTVLVTISESGSVTADAKSKTRQEDPKRGDCVESYFRRAKLKPPNGRTYTTAVTVVPPL
jgi:hypothetical protein